MSLVVEFMKTAHRTVATKPTFSVTSLICFQRDVTAAALTVSDKFSVCFVFAERVPRKTGELIADHSENG